MQRWQEAATAFEESLKYKDDGAVAPQARARARERVPQAPQAEGRHPAARRRSSEQHVDKEVQDDALEQLAWCQTEIEAWNDAKNTWRTLLRKFPDSHYAPEAKLALQTLMQNH